MHNQEDIGPTSYAAIQGGTDARSYAEPARQTGGLAGGTETGAQKNPPLKDAIDEVRKELDKPADNYRTGKPRRVVRIGILKHGPR